MGFLDTVKQRFGKKHSRALDPVWSSILDYTCIDGYPPVVMDSINFISDMIASMPIKLYRKKSKDIVEIKDDIRIFLLNCDTRENLSGYQFKNRMVMDYFLSGNGYAYIRKRGTEYLGLVYIQEPIYFNTVNPESILNKKYYTTINGHRYESYEFIKLLRNTRNGVAGNSVISGIKNAIDACNNYIYKSCTTAARGGIPPGFWEIPHLVRTRAQQLTDKIQRMSGDSQDEEKKIKEGLKNQYLSSAKKVGAITVLNGGVKFYPLVNTDSEGTLFEAIKILNDQICNIFHIKTDFYMTYKEAIYPVMKAFEAALTMDLLTDVEKEEGKFFKFDPTELLKADMKERYDAYREAISAGFMQRAEVRSAEGLPKKPGLDYFSVSLGDSNIRPDGSIYTPNTGILLHPDGTMQTPGGVIQGGQAKEKPVKGGENEHERDIKEKDNEDDEHEE